MRQTCWQAVVFLASLAPALSAATAETAPQAEVLAAPPDSFERNVVSIGGESLPVGLRLRMFTENLVDLSRLKLPSGAEGVSRVHFWLARTGLETVEASTLAALVARYDEFQADQLERWKEERRRATRAGLEGLFAGVSEGFTMERAELVGGLLGRLLRESQLDPKQAGATLLNVLQVHGRSGSIFTDGGDGPSYEEFEKEARHFEVGFQREFGVSLQTLMRQAKEAKP